MTSGDVRQGIHFDLDTAALKKYYPKQSWRMAYDDVRSFLESNGFEHEQGSGYHSKEPMIQSDAMGIIDDMLAKYPWLHKCVRVGTIADVPITYDLTPLFDKDADIPERSEEKKPSVLAELRNAREANGDFPQQPKRDSKKKTDRER